MILGIIAIVVNRKNKKTLSIIGIVLGILTWAVVLKTQDTYSKAVDHAEKSVSKSLESSSKYSENSDTDTSSSSSVSSTDSNIKDWTQADYDALPKGDIMNNGAGGANMEDVIKTYGKPMSSTDSSVNNMSTRTSIWTNTNCGLTANVTLSFMKQDDGSYLLYSALSSGLK